MNGQIQIDKNIPVPKATGDATRKYPFNTMESGDSFAVPADADPKKVATAAWQFGRVKGWKFSTRKTPDGYRCWRVS